MSTLKNLFFPLLFLLCLPGCTNIGWVGSPTADFPWKSEGPPDKPCKDAECTQNEAISAFIAASRFCREVGNFYEFRSNRSSGAQLAVGWVGAIAGAVVSPLAQGAAKTAWSGLSGATNAMQTQLTDTFSAALYIRRQAAVAQAADDAASKILSDSKSSNDRVYLSVDMVRRCALAASKVDANVLQAISTVEKNSAQEKDVDKNK